MHPLVERLPNRVQRGRAGTEAAVVALLERPVRIGVQRREITHRHVQVLGAVGTDGEQLVLLGSARQTQHRALQALARKSAIELHGILPHKGHQHCIAARGSQGVEDGRVVVGPERDEGLGHHFATRLGNALACDLVRNAGPDVVVAHQHPALALAVGRQPGDRRTQLASRSFADGVDAGCRLTAFVKAGVDIRQAPAHRRRDALAHRTDVHADQGIDFAVFDEADQGLFDVGRFIRRVHRQQFARPPQDARHRVELGCSQLGRRHARWPPDPLAAAHRDAQRHPHQRAATDQRHKAGRSRSLR